jgi:hypothetical protein
MVMRCVSFVHQVSDTVVPEHCAVDDLWWLRSGKSKPFSGPGIPGSQISVFF